MSIGKDLNGLDGSGVKGFVMIDIESEDGKIKRHIQPNTVTNVGKLAMLSRSANEMLLGFSGSPYDKINTVDMLGTYDSLTNASRLMYTKQDNGLNNYLLNLGAVNFDVNSKFVNLLDSNFAIDATKLVGFANSRDTTVDVREGVQDFTKPAYMIDDICIANRWKYAEGQATGTFDHIVMAPGIHGDLKCNGIYSKKCITRINQFEDVATFGNMFIIPGAGAITSSTKILLNYNRGGVSRWYYDLSTGETTAVPNTDVAYSMTMYESWDQAIYNGFLYVLDKTGWIRKINLTTGATDASLQVMTYYTCGASMYLSGTNLICMSSYNSEEGTYDARANVYTVSTTTFTITNTATKIASPLVGGVPTGWSRNRMIAKKCGSYFYVNFMFEVIKCTDLKNIKGTVVGTYLAHPLVHYASDGTNTWTIEVGVNNIDYPLMETSKNSNLDYGTLTRSDQYSRVMDNGTERLYQYHNNGVWIGKEWAGNILSFVKLTTPIVKAPTDIIYVSYGYKFV